MNFELPDLSIFLPHLLASLPAILLVLAGAYIAHVIICRALRALSHRTRLREADTAPISRFADWMIVAATLVLLFNVLGFNLGGVWTMMSAVLAMIAIGFVAVWSILSNISCTVLILLVRPFSVGDEIEFVGEATKGRVRDLNLIYTTLTAEDGADIQVPNNLFFQKVLKRRRRDSSGSGPELADQLRAPKPS
jgi:small-conductance mechanosensitive channel